MDGCSGVSSGVHPAWGEAGSWMWWRKTGHGHHSYVGHLTGTTVRNDDNNYIRDASVFKGDANNILARGGRRVGIREF